MGLYTTAYVGQTQQKNLKHANASTSAFIFTDHDGQQQK